MAQQDERSGEAGAPGSDPGEGLGPGEREQLVYALENRFADHLEAAASAVREAERQLAEAQEDLRRAVEQESARPYRSDSLVFMREAMNEEVDGLHRKTNPKKVRAAYRFLLDRAVELAAGEVAGFHDDQAAERRGREHGVQACQEAEKRAVAAVEEARRMQERVRNAEALARQGLTVLADKLE
ncbi:hypothetical protein FNH13_01890 [Ornithinimicrobium ciconiae]|uniref:Uncharacterized protein n=1 Tax=Ornithinimicrobium ciconiae TaxID=2594265 RepID=A0A516G6X5_9MICO|nr:hypothetical protein [Ornithinimicrobium ciconiae]QDO87232.1 hypothetical protein FNH13_01890 [Ornithinimicrobium ciconiae]